MERLRASRLSPIPGNSGNGRDNVFPTVLEEPVTPGSEDPGHNNPTLGESPTENNNCSGAGNNSGHLFRKHRRRLPLVQPANLAKNRSSRSFDSGISCLLQHQSSEPGSPGPISDPGNLPGSPNHISSSRQSYMSSSPCNSPGPRSPRLPGLGCSRQPPLSPRLQPAIPVSSCAGTGFFGPSFIHRRFSEQTESYSVKSSEDSDSSPPTEASPPPGNGTGGSSSPGPPTSPILRVSRRMLPETPKSPYNVWEQSRDSLDSGVYSRSTTCDSYQTSGGRTTSGGSPILSSTSPPTLARHSWRRGGVARLPEPPINSNINSNSGSTQEISSSNLIEESSKRVHFESNNASPSTRNRLGLLASLKNTYNSKLEQSPVKTGTSGILTKLHEKLAGTRSSPSQPCSPLSNLDVPKLRDLKSHSFPPPFKGDKSSCSSQETSGSSNGIALVSESVVINSSSTDSSSNEFETADDRRKRWLIHNHSSSTFVSTG